MALRILLAGGGTAGHVNPLLATAEVLRERGHEVSVLGTAEGLEAELVPEAGFPLLTIPRVPIPRRPSPELFTVPSRLTRAVSLAGEALEGIDVLVGFGGYVSAPAYIAATKKGVPFVVQEQNVRPGLANRLGARRARSVSLAFPQTKLQAARGRTVFTGLPLRRSIVELAEQRLTPDGAARGRKNAAHEFDLDPQRPILLVTGGSLGAQHLNEVLIEGAQLFEGQVQILHATGRGKSEEVMAAAAQRPDLTWVVREYISNMNDALAAADLVLCRSGAGTVAELGILGIPAFYVPLPIGNGEQRRNAEQQVEAGGAILVEDRDFNLKVLRERVLPLLTDPQRLRAMGRANRSTSPGDGAALLADLVEEATGGRE
ncbi:undecaprenyldiphospho-muramoylpentapeptide beta-N-acetylglucosaminyltransferase [Actinomyces minihominis]|uniref:undecaprenyldiphospho-muramoylpentapeptide beta-N-acetylglucosaminyltransferase n=1 Tax=Actinomyces minihominis TaxID=2002838 RepID=UPI000C07C6CE|nr:undecaprenyldiphospho-muramoylpentapeptide beta-N-acetylglucosaminyltransferase [Actinomyces minihominis]